MTSNELTLDYRKALEDEISILKDLIKVCRKNISDSVAKDDRLSIAGVDTLLRLIDRRDSCYRNLLKNLGITFGV